MAESGKYTFDEWVGKIRPDPRNTDQLTLLQGYIGQSSESGHIRVYSDETLNNFVEVPEDAILFAQQLSQTESSLGGSKLWLRSDAVITYGDPQLANRPKSTFLEGDLLQQYTTQYGGYDPTGGNGAFVGQPAGYGGQFNLTATTNCHSQPIDCLPQVTGRNNCTSYFMHCTQQVTGRNNCTTTVMHCHPQVTNTTTNMGGYYGTFNPYMM